MKIFYTKEEVAEMTYKQAKDALRLLEKTYPMNKPLSLCMPEVWPVLDDICTTLLELEDLINKFENPVFQTYDKETGLKVEPKAYVPVVERKVIERPVRKFRTPKGTFNSVEEAAQILKMKKKTLQVYISRKPDEYGYVD